MKRKKGSPPNLDITLRHWYIKPTTVPLVDPRRVVKSRPKDTVPTPKPPAKPKTLKNIAKGKMTKPWAIGTDNPVDLAMHRIDEHQNKWFARESMRT
ncbi:MAG: hypothetical protein ABSF43_01700 [Rectinemataceae bacterium]